MPSEQDDSAIPREGEAEDYETALSHLRDGGALEVRDVGDPFTVRFHSGVLEYRRNSTWYVGADARKRLKTHIRASYAEVLYRDGGIDE